MKKYTWFLILSLVVNKLNASGSEEDLHIINSSQKTLLEQLSQLAIPIKNNTFPNGLPFCAAEDIEAFKERLNIETLPSEFVKFVRSYGHYVFKRRNIIFLQTHFQDTQTLPLVLHAWEASVPKTHLPFCYDNGDYYCLNLQDGTVHFWNNNSKSFSEKASDTWHSFYDWIEKDWLPLMK